MSVASHLGIRLADYDRRVRTFIPHYEEILSAVADAAATASRRRQPVVVDLGIGTGALADACARRLHPRRVVGIDMDAGMLAACRRRLGGLRALELIHADFSAFALPRCDVIMATLALHHLRTARGKRAFYRRCFEALSPGGLLVSGDCCPSSDRRLALAERQEWVRHLRASYSAANSDAYLAAWAAEDRYFALAAEIEMLHAAGFGTDVTWRRAPFAVVVARKAGRLSSKSHAAN
jgi:demethylmenaquinone methyltransferase/2-methoxy-6-polyprenyl-1,4-benzoquinol methylase